MAVCDICGKEDVKNMASHIRAAGHNVDKGPATAVAEKPRSERRGRQRGERLLTPLEQIPLPPGAGSGSDTTGAGGYYVRGDGATIGDCLKFYPNGGVPQISDQRKRSMYGRNAEYYRQRQARRGLEFIGSTLTPEGIKRLLEVMDENRDDEIYNVKLEIENAQGVSQEADIPEVRNQARRRVGQLQKRLAYLEQPVDADAMEKELKDIARAMRLSKVPPEILETMEELNEETRNMIAHFSGKQAVSAGGVDDFEGEDHLDRD